MVSSISALYVPVHDHRPHSRRRCLRELLLCAAVLGLAMVCACIAHAASFTPTRFTVVDAGTTGKPDVLLIPGLSSSPAVWDGEAKLLAPNYRLHLVQINGFAGQPSGANATGPLLVPVVAELHSYLSATQLHPVVIGHSLGGLLGLMLADKYPGDVRKLVIVDSLPAYVKLFSPAATPDSARPQIEAMRQQLTALPADQYAAMQPMMAARMVTDPAGQKLVAQSAAASDRTVAINAMVEDMLTDVTPDLASLQTPTLLLYPYEPGVQKQEEVDALYHDAYKTMPHITLKRIDNSRHFILYDQPAAMDSAIENFLR